MKLFFSPLRDGLLAALLLLLLLGPRGHAQTLQVAALIQGGLGSSVQLGPTATDAAGNVFVTGTFFGSVTIGSTTLTARGYRDMFVAKWNPTTSSLTWVQQVSGTTYIIPNKLVVSGSSLYLAGGFSYTAVFGTTTLTSGIYALRVQAGATAATRRLVVE